MTFVVISVALSTCTSVFGGKSTAGPSRAQDDTMYVPCISPTQAKCILHIIIIILKLVTYCHRARQKLTTERTTET